MSISRRTFMKRAAAAAGASYLSSSVAAQGEGTTGMEESNAPVGAIVICNHWTQYGIGETFPEGQIGPRWYRKNFSTVLGFEQGRRWLEQDPRNRVCHEFDAYFLESLAEEDPAYLGTIRKMLDDKRMELPGGTYGQAESQVFGYESAIRQLTMGQAAYHEYLGRAVDTFLVEEQNFFPQLPQLLKQAGFQYASIQFQNSGTPDAPALDLILWEAPDGTALPTIPNHPGMQSCARQWESYDAVVARMDGHKAPLVFQWMELWPPGLDWGASVMPYRDAIHGIEKRGYKQMLLTEYVRWALGRCDAPRVRIPLDHSNYNNNFFQGGWGYENERTARGSNQCESLLLAAEALCAGNGAKLIEKKIKPRLRELWSRLLVSQNHDPYLAGALPAYVDGVRSLQSELAVKQLTTVREVLRDEAKLDVPLSETDTAFRLFNPCPWPVVAPVMLELATPVWPEHAFELEVSGTRAEVAAAWRSDSGNVVLSPAMVKMGAYGVVDARMQPTQVPGAPPKKAVSKQDGHTWGVAMDAFDGIEFTPLTGMWRQVPSYFTNPHPNINLENVYEKIDDAPVDVSLQVSSGGMDVVGWRRDLMRIREVEEPALTVQGLLVCGNEPVSFVQVNQRVVATIRFQTGHRPVGTWRFALRVPGKGLKIIADSPFCEEERQAEFFYCSRYVRLEWPGRHVLWCPSQNTLFRRVPGGDGDTSVIECTVFDFAFTGSSNWDMRFYGGESFSAAESFRMAEQFHRKPIIVPNKVSAGRLAGVAVDNPDVAIVTAFPAEDGAVAIRTCNCSNVPQEATFTWPRKFTQVMQADLCGNPIGQAESSRRTWHWQFRPWEIRTFRITA